MQDTVTFVDSIETPNFDEAVNKFFDQHMVLYNLVGSCTNIEKILGEVGDSNISFILNFDTEENANKMYCALQSSIAYVFNRKFDIDEEVHGSSLIVKFI